MGSAALGSAVLEIRVDRSCVVRGSRVVSASGDLPNWRSLAEDLRGARTEGIRLPAGAVGAWMRLELDAELTTPSGVPAGQVAVLYPGAIGFDVAELAGGSSVRNVHVTVLSEVWY